MPKIRIKEVDNTGRVQGTAISNIVYVPIRFNTDITKTTTGVPAAFSDISLFTSAKVFTDMAETKVGIPDPNAEIELWNYANVTNNNTWYGTKNPTADSVKLADKNGFIINTVANKGCSADTSHTPELKKAVKVGKNTLGAIRISVPVGFDGNIIVSAAPFNAGDTIGLAVNTDSSKTGLVTYSDEKVGITSSGTGETHAFEFAVDTTGAEAVTDYYLSTSNDQNVYITKIECQGALNPAIEREIIDTRSLGYKLCVHLLNIGYEILVEALGNADTPSWDKLKDKNLYDVRFLTLGADFITETEAKNAIATAATRGDCVALINLDESTDIFSYDVSTVRDSFEQILTTQNAGGDDVLGVGADFAAGFTPWFFTRHQDFRDADATTVTSVKIPAAFGYLFAYANATKNNPEWYAIAGFERGVIPELYDVCYNYTTAEVEVLQGRSVTENVELDNEDDNNGIAINPICYVRPAGHILYGNRTLKDNSANNNTLTATAFLNIRNGLSAIKKVMYEAARKYTFEQNTEILWINFQAYITPLLDRMQSGNGILGYTFVKQKTDKKARLKARLNLIPVEAVEDFDLEVYLTDDLTVSE